MSISDRPGLGHLNLSGPGLDPNKIKVINTGNKCFVAKKILVCGLLHHTTLLSRIVALVAVILCAVIEELGPLYLTRRRLAWLGF